MPQLSTTDSRAVVVEAGGGDDIARERGVCVTQLVARRCASCLSCGSARAVPRSGGGAHGRSRLRLHGEEVELGALKERERGVFSAPFSLSRV